MFFFFAPLDTAQIAVPQGWQKSKGTDVNWLQAVPIAAVWSGGPATLPAWGSSQGNAAEWTQANGVEPNWLS